jgi:hypothetical protein
MDSSDVTAQRKAAAIYADMLVKFKAAAPVVNDCERLCNCTSQTCPQKHFKTYEAKMAFEKGAQTCPCAP